MMTSAKTNTKAANLCVDILLLDENNQSNDATMA